MTDRTLDLLCKARDELATGLAFYRAREVRAELVAEIDAHLQRPEAPEGAQPVACRACSASGEVFGKDGPTICPECDGTGEFLASAGQSEEARDSFKSLDARITEYLSLGGLFNPEMMEHDKVRDLLMDCRAAMRKETP